MLKYFVSLFFTFLVVKTPIDASDSGDCSICIESLEAEKGEEQLALRTLRCGHKFHNDCLEKYITHTPNPIGKDCPLCRSTKHLSHIQADEKMVRLRTKYRGASSNEEKLRYYLSALNLVQDGHSLTLPYNPLLQLDLPKKRDSEHALLLLVIKFLSDPFFRQILIKSSTIELILPYLSHPSLKLRKASSLCFQSLVTSTSSEFKEWSQRKEIIKYLFDRLDKEDNLQVQFALLESLLVLKDQVREGDLDFQFYLNI